MYLLCAKSPQGPPITPGQSPLFKTKIDPPSADSKIVKLRDDIAKLLQMEPNSFNLLYCGRILDDEKTVGFYKIKSTSSVHVIPKAPKQETEEIEEKRNVTDEELQQFMIAFGMAVKNPAFNRVAQGLAKKENLESLIAANPSLAKDPIACGFLSKPELLLSLLDPETYKYVYERHPGLAEAAYQLAATVHEEKPTPSSGNDNDGSGSANPFAYNLDEMSDDDEDDEDMDVGPVGSGMAGQRNNSMSGITSDQLAAALASAQNIFGGMTGMGLMGAGGAGAQASPSNPGPSRTTWPSSNPSAGDPFNNPLSSSSPRITQDALSAALAAATSSINSPASSSSNQGLGSNLFFNSATASQTSASRPQGLNFGGGMGENPLSSTGSEQTPGQGTQDTQIATIREYTGITDSDLASRALQLMGGDLQAAIDLILSGWLGQDDTTN